MVIKVVVLYFKFLIKTAFCLENVMLRGRYVLGKAKFICYVEVSNTSRPSPKRFPVIPPPPFPSKHVSGNTVKLLVKPRAVVK